VQREPQRQIRVFVSSTFRDMQAERDELIKRVFPRLRKRCESRGVAFSEVDLRWGVTDEQKAEGQVLPLCLAEIRRCRPYFLGLLGERYGWVPDEVSLDLAEVRTWLHAYEGRSVTELEILHGVLNDPDMPGHAFFYFRDPAALRALPPELRREFDEPSEANRRKLAALKDRIRTGGWPVREGFREPHELADLVLADFEALIDRLFPEAETPDSEARERAEHDAFIASRSRVYIPRQPLFDLLDDHVAGDGPPVTVLGESGTGKSALLANWIGKRLADADQGIPVVAHFVGASAQSADWAAICRRFIGELARVFDLLLTVPEETAGLPEALANAMGLAAEKGRYILVVDGLNQLLDRDGAPDLVWFPVAVPARARVFFSTLPGRSLDELGRRPGAALHLAPLDVSERERLITAFLARFGKALPPAHAHRLAASPQAANALFLRVVLDELRQHGRHETLVALLDDLLASPDVPALYQRVLARWEADFELDRPGLARDALCALWAARRGLSEAELLEVLGGASGRLPQAAWSPFFLAADEALLNRSGLLGFAHDFLRQAVETHYLPDQAARRTRHEHLATYFAAQPFAGRALDELPWQLAEAGAFARLADLLSDPEALEILCRHHEGEVKRLWARIESETDLSAAETYAPARRDELADPTHLWRAASLLAHLGYQSEALAMRERLVVCYRASAAPEGLQAALGNLALSYQAMGRLADAEALFREQERLCREIGSVAGLQAALNYLAIMLRARGDLAGSLALLAEQEALCRSHGLHEGLRNSLGNQALAHREFGDYDQALTLLGEQERLCRQADDLVGLQGALGNMALVLRAQGDLRGAAALHVQEERLARELGNLQNLQASLGNQAIVCKELGDLAGALRLHAEEERICRAIGYREGLRSSLGNQALLHYHSGDLDGALELHAAEEALCRELGSPFGLQASLGNQSLVRLECGEIEAALELAAEQVRICQEHAFKEALSCAYDNIGQILTARGDPRTALDYYRAAEAIAQEIGFRSGVAESYGNQASAMLALGQGDDALELLERQEAICRELGLAEQLVRALWRQGEALSRLGRSAEARFILESAAAEAASHGLDDLERKIGESLLLL
jgi:tetratricopeptide (TPR) repeat protein